MRPTSPGARYWPGLTFLALGVAAFALLQSMVIPVLTGFGELYGVSTSVSTWILTIYLISACVATPLLGRAGDIYGKKLVLSLSLGALAVGSIAAMLAPNITWMLVARAIQGLGGSVLPLSFGIVRDTFPVGRVRLAISFLSSLAAIGFGVGIVIAGPVIAVLGLRGMFLLPMALTLAAAIGVACTVPPSPRSRERGVSVLSASLLGMWLVALLVAVTQGNAWGWLSPRILALGIAGLILAGLWCWAESRAAVPVIDLQMMSIPAVRAANLVVVCQGFGLFGALTIIPQFLQAPGGTGPGFGATVTESGLIMAPAQVMSFIIGVLSSRLVRRIGSRWVVVIGCVSFGSAYLLVLLLRDHLWLVTGSLLLQGVGTALLAATLASVVVTAVPAHQTGVVSGMNANLRNIGGSIGTAIIVGVATGPQGEIVEHGYLICFIVIAAVMALGALLSFGIPDDRAEGHTF